MMTQFSSQIAKVSQRLLAQVSKDILVSVKQEQSAFTYNYTIAALSRLVVPHCHVPQCPSFKGAVIVHFKSCWQE